MNKKGITITTEELVALVLLIPALIFIYFSYNYVAGLLSPSEIDQQTKDNFQRLVREINDLAKEAELKGSGEKTEITIPLFQKDSLIIAYNYDTIKEGDLKLLPKNCKTENCICLFNIHKANEPTDECYWLNNIYFSQPVLQIGQESAGQIDVHLEITVTPGTELGDYELKIEKAKV
jgi:hypothetical protein